MGKSRTALWLSLRLRVFCGVILLISSLLPPYVPSSQALPQQYARETQQFLLVEDGFLMKSSPLTNRDSRMTFGEGVEHIVKPGESLPKIAERYNISIDTIRWANNLDTSTTLQPNDTLLILPVDGVLHRVSRGQTINGIAEIYNVEGQQIIAQNNLQGGVIISGQELIIPGGQPIVQAPIAVADAPASSSSVPSSSPSPSSPRPPAVIKPVEPTPPIRVSDVADTGALHKPCSAACFITQYFHGGHFALDMQERGGGPIFASEDGTVTRAETGWNGGYGTVIEVDHGNGLVTLYAHNKTLLVSKGDVVRRGQQIAWMGNTGLVYGATGIHVHFEVQQNGVKKNPLLYLE